MTKKSFFKICIFSFLAVLGLNIDLSIVTSLDNFLIEGVTLDFYQARNELLHESILSSVILFSGFSGNNVLWVGIFIAFCFLFYYATGINERRIKKYSIVMATVLASLYVIGFSINNYYSLTTVIGGRTALVKSIVAITGISLIFYALLLILFNAIQKTEINKGERIWLLECDRKAFWMRLFIIGLCWLPYLIVYFPGIVSVDTFNQISQALNESTLTNHHPLFMTGLFGLFIRFGLLFNSANTGVMLYSLMQMFICAVSFSYVIHVLAKKNINVYIRLFTFIFFALHPINAFYAMTMYKDTLFAIAFMLLTLGTIQLISSPEEFLGVKRNLFIYSALCTLLFLTRNNGLYIVLILLPILVLVLKGYRKKLSVITAMVITVFISMKFISGLVGAQSGSIGEALSVPLQQITRTVINHGENIKYEDRKLIEKILPYDRLPQLYDPVFADPVKESGIFNEVVFRNNIGAYISLWFRWLIKYPETYIEAFLCQTHGYWYPDIENAIVMRSVDPNEYGVHQVKIVPSIVEQAFSGIFVIRVFPVISMLLSIGFVVWIVFILAIILMLKREKYLLISFLPAILLWLSCLASPVSGMFRYVYGLFLILPLLISVTLQASCWQRQFIGDTDSTISID